MHVQCVDNERTMHVQCVDDERAMRGQCVDDKRTMRGQCVDDERAIFAQSLQGSFAPQDTFFEKKYMQFVSEMQKNYVKIVKVQAFSNQKSLLT